MIIKVTLKNDDEGKTIALVRDHHGEFRWGGTATEYLLGWMNGRTKAYFEASDTAPLSSGLPVLLADRQDESW